ncbi:hypothetical protein T06_7060 [Trichinella sp. T6]|nr:hypothetical protein T06_7060 [Trichinella sp. T6]
MAGRRHCREKRQAKLDDKRLAKAEQMQPMRPIVGERYWIIVKSTSCCSAQTNAQILLRVVEGQTISESRKLAADSNSIVHGLTDWSVKNKKAQLQLTVTNFSK